MSVPPALTPPTSSPANLKTPLTTLRVSQQVRDTLWADTYSRRTSAATGKTQRNIKRLREADDMAHEGVRIPLKHFIDTFWPMPPGVTEPPLPAENPFSEVTASTLEKDVAEAFVSG